MATAQRPGEPDLRTLMALAADHEWDASRAVEDPHPLVDRPRQGDQPIHRDKVWICEPDRRGEWARHGVAAAAGDRHPVLRAPGRLCRPHRLRRPCRRRIAG
jgi:hypothetical protein